jgi:predicted O-linked N-acetylglucosamine transferase (SPINDLY family)
VSRGNRFGSRAAPPRGPSRPIASPAAPPPELLQAVELHQRGQLAEAEGLYAGILARQPRLAEVLALYGYLAHQRGDDATALQRIEAGLKINPRMVDAHLWRGMSLQRLQRLAEAASSYREALRLNPRHVDALNNLGTVLTTEGQYAEAARLHESAIRLRPDRPHSHYCLGVARQRLGEHEVAARNFERAIQLRPDYVEAYNNLGVSLIALRRAEEGLVPLQRAIELDPYRPESYLNLGKALRDLSRFAGSEAAYRRALELRPDYSEARHSLANVLQDFGQLDEALEHLRYARETDPDYLPARSNLLMKLIYHAGVEPETIAAEHRELGAELVAKLPGDPARRDRERSPGRRLKVGYVSPDFHAHSCAFFLEPLIEAHDRAQVEVFCYSNTTPTDAVTDRLRKLSDHWRDIVTLSDAAVADLVAADGIDILVDCAGHTGNNRIPLFALKPAPLQATWLGYPHSTGLPTVDFRITDAVADPPGMTEAQYVERIVRLPDGFLCYRPFYPSPAPAPGPLQRGTGPVFGCFNNSNKIGPEVAAVWSALLAELPGARLKLRSRQFRDATVVERMRARFLAAGLASERLELSGWEPTIGEGLADYANIDIALDPFPYNGTTTTCEALWMGVPVVTLAGRVHAGRVGATLLARAGLERFVARDLEHYQAIAVSLARDRRQLDELRRNLRAAMAASPLCDARRFARALEDAYRAEWRHWCAEGAAERPAVARASCRAARPSLPDAVDPESYGEPAAAPAPLADRPTVRILHHMARSGGTLIAQCLGALPGVALLSEIHPKGVRFISPLRQAHDWYGLLTAEEVADLEPDLERRFVEAIALIESRARAAGLRLVLRDWSHLDYVGLPDDPAPSGRSALSSVLADRFNIRETCTVRHPIDQWESTRRLATLRGRVTLEQFLVAYRRFAENAVATGYLRFEDFAAAPEPGVRVLGRRLDLPYDPVFLANWSTNDKVTGDLRQPDRRRTEIVRPKRRPSEPGLLERFVAHPDYAPALALLGYRHPI